MYVCVRVCVCELLIHSLYIDLYVLFRMMYIIRASAELRGS